MELLQNLGVDWRLLIAQLINFVILLAVLYRFLYKPVLKLLHDRSQRIEDGLKHAEEAEVKLNTARESYEKKILEARAEAQKIVESAKKDAEKVKAELVASAQKDAEKIVMGGRNRLTAEKVKVMREAEEELADLVAHAAEHVLGEALTPEIDRKLIDEAVKKVRIGRA